MIYGNIIALDSDINTLNNRALVFTNMLVKLAGNLLNDKIKDGRYNFCNDIFIMEQIYETRDVAAVDFEYHQKNDDVFLVTEGSELVSGVDVKYLTPKLKDGIDGYFDSKQDIGFFEKSYEDFVSYSPKKIQDSQKELVIKKFSKDEIEVAALHGGQFVYFPAGLGHASQMDVEGKKTTNRKLIIKFNKDCKLTDEDFKNMIDKFIG